MRTNNQIVPPDFLGQPFACRLCISVVLAVAVMVVTMVAVVGVANAASDGTADQDGVSVNEPPIVRTLSPPRLAFHRGNTHVAQENSRRAIIAALESSTPNIEVDITNFISNGKEVGLLAHENEMQRTTGVDGVFQSYRDIESLPDNRENPLLEPEKFMTIIELFDLIKAYKTRDKPLPIVSLDIKVEENGEPFGMWLGNLIQAYGFEGHVFASSFWNGSLDGLKTTCAHCLTGGVVFQDHWALRFLDPQYSALDLADATKVGFFLGFPDKEMVRHDFVLIHDTIFFDAPEIADQWRDQRGVQFVGIFTQGDHGVYSEEQWRLIREKNILWLELSPDHIGQTRSHTAGNDHIHIVRGGGNND